MVKAKLDCRIDCNYSFNLYPIIHMKPLKYIVTALLLIIGNHSFSQTKKCSNYTLSLDLNSTDTVRIRVNTPYRSVMPVASSSVWATKQISVVKKSSTVNSNKPGTYQECFVAQDGDGLSVECCRTVIVYDASIGAGIGSINYSNDMVVTPNPVKDGKFEVIINNSMFNGLATFKLIDVSGKDVFYITREMAGSCEFTLPAIIPGVYYMKVIHEGNVAVTKMVFL